MAITLAAILRRWLKAILARRQKTFSSSGGTRGDASRRRTTTAESTLGRGRKDSGVSSSTTSASARMRVDNESKP
ncbi:MAG: hypothetical protein A2V88_07345 [Elusimicrobia bacterium RBG_16_66_12]|nr:MAG: hypothetical protein A2V88_07345 [Elusimicrobia bacterium RBG_16_66_12]